MAWFAWHDKLTSVLTSDHHYASWPGRI